MDGRRYVVEASLTDAELEALVADYLAEGRVCEALPDGDRAPDGLLETLR
jgi:hypothetical protein